MLLTIQETSSVDALKILLQLSALLLGSFAGGVAMGRLWFSRSLEIKNATIEQKETYAVLLTETVETAQSLDALKKQIERLRPPLPDSNFLTSLGIGNLTRERLKNITPLTKEPDDG